MKYITQEFIDHMDEYPSVKAMAESDASVTVLFSGGIDSTILLEYLIYKRIQMGISLLNITIISSKMLKNNALQTEREAKAQGRVIRLLNKEYGSFLRVKDGIEYSVYGPSGTRNGQYPFILATLMHCNHFSDFILTGHIKDDEVYCDDFEESNVQSLFNAFNALQSNYFVPITLMMPLLNFTKYDIITKFVNKKTITHTSSCINHDEILPLSKCDCEKCKNIKDLLKVQG